MAEEEADISIPPSSNPQITIRTNDNSNPQQGTGGAKNLSGIGAEPPCLKIPPTTKDDRKLFVGGLPTDVTDDEFRTFFEQFGTVIDSVVMYDRETRNSRGFGFVTFDDPDVSKSLLQMGNHADGIGRLNMRGKTCEVKRAEPKHPGRAGKKKSRQQVPPSIFPPEAFIGNGNFPPHQGNAGFNGYMAPMYYPFPPPLFASPSDQVGPPPPAHYNMGHYTDPYMAAGYPPPPPSYNPQPFAFLPVMAFPPPPPVPPQQETNPSLLQPVVPGIPTKGSEDPEKQGSSSNE